MKRALKFFLVFIAAATFIFAIVIGFNYSAFKTLFANNDGMRDGYEYIESTYSLKALTEFIGNHPEYMSVVSFNVNDPDSGIYYNADVPRTLGSLSIFFLLLEYERQVEDGVLNQDEVIPNPDVFTRYALNDISEEAHRKSLEFLEVEDQVPIKLDKLVEVMAETSDLTLADFLWFKLGKENINNLMDSLGVEHTDAPLPFTGLYLSISPEVVDTSKEISASEIIELAQKMNSDSQFSEEMKELFKKRRLNISFMEERDALEHFPHTTPREIALLMAKLYKNELISPQVSERVKEKMKWVFEGEAIKRSFSEYGALYDARMGMLSGIDFGTSKYDGHTSAQAVFFDKLPVAFWLHLSANRMQEDYQQRLIWDPALYETTQMETSN